MLLVSKCTFKLKIEFLCVRVHIVTCICVCTYIHAYICDIAYYHIYIYESIYSLVYSRNALLCDNENA